MNPSPLSSSSEARADVTLSGLPESLVEQVQSLQREDPRLLERMLEYVLMRKRVFDVLAENR